MSAKPHMCGDVVGERFLGVLWILAALSGCNTNTGAIADQKVVGSTIGGPVTNIATAVETAPIEQSADIRLALDPSSFAAIFGPTSVAKPTRPTPSQLSQLNSLADQSSSASERDDILKFIGSCKQDQSRCSVIPK